MRPTFLLTVTLLALWVPPMFLPHQAGAEDGLRFGPSSSEMPPGQASPVEQPPQPEEQPPVDYNQPPPEMPAAPQLQNPAGMRYPRQPRPMPGRPGADGSAPPVSEMEVIPGPVERLKALGENHGLSELVAVVKNSRVPGIEQKPAMAVADGESELKLFLTRLGGSDEPGLVLANLHLERFSRSRAEGWVLVAVPEKGAYDATVFINNPGSVLNVPVLVTPLRDVDFDGNGAVDDADLARLRAGSQQGNLAFDLNSDGEFDAADEYIFVANYLLRLEAGPR